MSEWNCIDKFMAQIRYRAIEKYVPREGGIIADIGCGREAAFLKHCAPFIKHGYGFDFRISNQKTDRLTLINNKNSDRLDIESNCCNVVFMLAVLEHLDQPDVLLKEIYRILDADGILCLTTPTPLSKPVLECMAKLHIINEEEILEHKHYYKDSEIYELITACGFVNYKYRKFCFGMNSIAVAEKR